MYRATFLHVMSYELSCFEWFAGLLTATHHAQSHRSKHHRRGYSKGLQARKASVGENMSKPIAEFDQSTRENGQSWMHLIRLRAAARRLHPDKGGKSEEFQE